MSNKPIHFESFFYKANIFFNCIGVNAYDKVSNEPRRGKLALVRRHLQRIIFTVTIVNLNLTLLSVLIQIFLDIVNNNNFVEATTLGSIGNALIISELKIFSIWWQRSRISSLMQELYALYPQTLGGQMLYQVKAELKNWNRLGNAYIILNVLLVWSYTLWPLISYLIFEYWLELRKVGKMLSFNCWTPFVWCDNWLYYPMYLSQLTVAHACISTQLANDLLFSAVAVQLIMHYRQLAKRIESYVVAESGGNEMKKRRLSDLERSEIDLRFLHGIIAYHQKILTLSKAMNKAFGICMLLTFAMTSVNTCIELFQITAKVTIDMVVLGTLFLLSSLVDLFFICYYAQGLLESSEYISNAIYNHNWYDADMRYKRLALLMMQRAQKPAEFKATLFVTVSMPTITNLLQMSYQGFAIVRTAYARQPGTA